MIEDEYTYDKMIVLRKFANKLLTQNEENKKVLDHNEQSVKDMQDKKIGWGVFISKSKKEEEMKAINEYRQKIQQEYEAKRKQQEEEDNNELNLLT